MTIGILGGGQLGMMLAEAAKPLGHECVFLDPNPEACAKAMGQLIVGDYADEAALKRLAEQVDVVTYEFENVPVQSVQFLQKSVAVYPSESALDVAQDRLSEKQLARELGIGTAPFVAVGSADELVKAVDTLGVPCILKTRREGYDGKGQIRITDAADLTVANELVSQYPCLLEGSIAFERELSIIATRSQSGEMCYYPLAENVHRNGILHTSVAPADVTPEMTQRAQAIAQKMMEHFGYVGTMAVELFVTSDQELLVNEIAPRVHNSGHWSIEGAVTSQFANHIRAITGMELGPVDAVGYSAMINVIGIGPPLDALGELPDTHLHMYGKSERPGRKIGHITIQHAERAVVQSRCAEVLALMPTARP